MMSQSHATTSFERYCTNLVGNRNSESRRMKHLTPKIPNSLNRNIPLALHCSVIATIALEGNRFVRRTTSLSSLLKISVIAAGHHPWNLKTVPPQLHLLIKIRENTKCRRIYTHKNKNMVGSFLSISMWSAISAFIGTMILIYSAIVVLRLRGVQIWGAPPPSPASVV